LIICFIFNLRNGDLANIRIWARRELQALMAPSAFAASLEQVDFWVDVLIANLQRYVVD
jgi:hypothetical protein